MPYTEPTIDDLRFAEDDVVDPVSGQNNAVEPASIKKDNGFIRSETPPRQDFNWLFRMLWQAIRWAHDELMHPGQVGGTSALSGQANKAAGHAVAQDTGLVVSTLLAAVNSSTGRASGYYSQVNASVGGSLASGNKSQVNASDIGTASGNSSQVNASYQSEASGVRSIVASSQGVEASGARSAVIASSKYSTGVVESNGAADSAIIASASTGAGNTKASGDQSAVIASIGDATGSEAGGDRSAVIASRDGVIGPALTEAAIIAAGGCNITGTGSCDGIIASDLCNINDSYDFMAACYDVDINDSDSAALASAFCEVQSTTARSVLLSSMRVKTANVLSVTGGYNGSGNPLTSNRKWELDSVNGNIYGAGTVAGSHTFTDFAEYFENLEMGIIPLGTIVALEGSKVRPAKDGDAILGTVTGTAGFVCGDTQFTWSGRYLNGEFGEPLYDEIADPDYKGEGEAPKIRVRRENPEYKPELENIPRRERKEEWSCVALIGQVHVRVGKNVQVGNYVEASGGKSFGNEPTRLLCMKIKQAFDKDKGYAVALCLLR